MINNKCFFFDLFMNKFNSSRFSNIDHISKHDWKSFSNAKAHISNLETKSSTAGSNKKVEMRSA